VSPIIDGKAVKGPTAKIMSELGLPTGAAAVAQHYADILDIYVADEADADEIAGLGIPVRLTHTLMLTVDDREALARAVLAAVSRVF
jgi:LPPG:FO 2-phospho-L-lactate transferase